MTIVNGLTKNNIFHWDGANKSIQVLQKYQYPIVIVKNDYFKLYLEIFLINYTLQHITPEEIQIFQMLFYLCTYCTHIIFIM